MSGIVKMAKDSRGNYRRDLGWESKDGKYVQHRFYLGNDYAQASVRAARLERLWAAVEEHWNRERQAGGLADRPRPLWDVFTIQMGLAVAKGEESTTIDVAADPNLAVILEEPLLMMTWFESLGQAFGSIIRLHLAGPWRERLLAGLETDRKIQTRIDVDRTLREGGEVVCLPKGAGPVAQTAGSQTLHQALDIYSDWLGSTMLRPDGSGLVTPSGALHQRQVRQVKAHAADVPLSRFDLAAIDSLLHYWQNRPVSRKTNRPMSPDTVRDVMKRVRHFLKWLHRSQTFDWRLPPDYTPDRMNVRLTHAEVAAKARPQGKKTYSLDELATLWEYASPHERVFMSLALNCGFGQAEIASLQLDEFESGPHGHYPMTGDWIKRIRFKTGVYGEWLLWPETVRAVEWAKRRRGDSSETALILTRTGRPLSTPTTKGNRNMAIANAWYTLLKRVRKDFPNFRGLSFNKLRKTSSTFVRKKAGGEAAGMFLCHGRVCSDDLLERYAERDFRIVFRATRKLRKVLDAPVFARVEDPFPQDATKSNPSVTPMQKRRMKELRKQGFKIVKIAEIMGLSRDTVRRYSK